jgi:hypothetical protein
MKNRSGTNLRCATLEMNCGKIQKIIEEVEHYPDVY